MILAPFVNFYNYEKNYIIYKSFPVWDGKAFRTGGKDYPVWSGISFPFRRNMQDEWKELRDEDDPEYTHRIETVMLHTFGQYALGTLIHRRIPIMTEGTGKMWTFVPFLVGPEEYIIGKLEKKTIEDPMKLEWRRHKGDSSTDWCIGDDWTKTTVGDLISLAVQETEENLFKVQHLHSRIDALVDFINEVSEKT